MESQQDIKIMGGRMIQFDGKTIEFDEQLTFTGEQIDHEIYLISNPKNRSIYPQGRDFVISQLIYAKRSGKIVSIYLKKTWPRFTYYFSVH